MLTPYSDILDVSYRETTENHPFYSHIRPVEVKKLFHERGWDYDSYYKIVCTRNPFNRLVSLYEMIFRKWPIKPPFDFWLKSTRPSGKGGGGKNSDRWRMYGTYSLKNFISDEKGEVIVDRIIQLERFKEEIPELFKELNLDYGNDFTVVRKNVRKRKRAVKDYYSEKSKQLVYERYAWEIEKFGYTFPE